MSTSHLVLGEMTDYLTGRPILDTHDERARQHVARFLVEESGAMIVGADNLSFEAFPSEVETNYVPVHSYLLAEQGTPIMELVYLEELSRAGIYEFAFIGGSLKLRGSDAAPIRPIAIPLATVNREHAHD